VEVREAHAIVGDKDEVVFSQNSGKKLIWLFFPKFFFIFY
jgi:hypothetical protein